MPKTVCSLSLLFFVATFVGCAQWLPLQSKAFAGQELDPVVGTIIELTEALEVPAGDSIGWFNPAFHQSPDLSLLNLLQISRLRDEVKCGFRLAKPVPRGGTSVQIGTGVFTVVRVVRESSPLGIDPTTASPHGNFATDVTLIYRIDLEFKEQPQVASLYCSQRHASLTRQDTFPNAADLKKQAGFKLLWVDP